MDTESIVNLSVNNICVVLAAIIVVIPQYIVLYTIYKLYKKLVPFVFPMVYSSIILLATKLSSKSNQYQPEGLNDKDLKSAIESLLGKMDEDSIVVPPGLMIGGKPAVDSYSFYQGIKKRYTAVKISSLFREISCSLGDSLGISNVKTARILNDFSPRIEEIAENIQDSPIAETAIELIFPMVLQWNLNKKFSGLEIKKTKKQKNCFCCV